MRSFKEYLIENKQTYNFKIKIAGKCPDDCTDKIKGALAQYDVAECSAGNSTPIQESHFDFPDLKNVEVTVFEVTLNYPTTSTQIAASVASALGKTESSVRVRNPLEEAEVVLNHANDSKSNESLLGKDYGKDSNQDLVGEKHKMSLLKDLTKNKKTLEQYKGVNDKILAKKAPAEKSAKAEKVSASKSPLGAVSNPDPRKGK